MLLSVPDNGSPELIDVIADLAATEGVNSIYEIYGSAKESVVGTGREQSSPLLSRSDTDDRARRFRDLGFSYNFVLNSPVPKARFLDIRPAIIEELEWLEGSGITDVTLGNYELVRLAERYSPSLRVCISAFAQVKTMAEFDQWAQLKNVGNICIDFTAIHNVGLLEQMSRFGEGVDCKIKVIANLACLPNCVRQTEHSIINSMSAKNKGNLHYGASTFYCMNAVYKEPHRFMSLNILRPEDISTLENLGVACIKLTDRNRDCQWIRTITEAYIRGEYHGNILDLTSQYSALGLPEFSLDDVLGIDIEKVLSSPDGVREYRRNLPSIMPMEIDNDSLHACEFSSGDCAAECSARSDRWGDLVRFDPVRRKVVLGHLERLVDEYLYV